EKRPHSTFAGHSPEEALEALKNQPSYDELKHVLTYLREGSQGHHSFDVLKPSPQGAQIVHVLVTEIVPNYWSVIKENSSDNSTNHDLNLLLSCLLSMTGINATLTFLKVLLQNTKTDPKGVKQSHFSLDLGTAIDFLDQLLKGNAQLQAIWLG
ncbi:hypothetical protein I5L01_15735, partial [Erythrobacter sp. YJ-T3-07]|uniref:hypothetical protein n=1 Tax=Erythrobacter sp. YJ-T3-07 TaxID=2793063 RepID=UPI0018D4096C|nr:hypothetical protein [Erythrobacter sp. YJ-T3-07]